MREASERRNSESLCAEVRRRRQRRSAGQVETSSRGRREKRAAFTCGHRNRTEEHRMNVESPGARKADDIQGARRSRPVKVVKVETIFLVGSALKLVNLRMPPGRKE